MEEWREYLEYMANRLERCANSMDILFGEECNEYKDKLDEIMHMREKRTENKDGSVTISHTLTPEEEEIREKYWEREKEIYESNLQYNKETYRMIVEVLGHLWD